MKHVEAAHPLVTRQRVADSVVANVPDMQCAAGIRQHLQHIIFRLAGIFLGLKQGAIFPALVPLHFDLVEVVLLFRHSLFSVSMFLHSSPSSYFGVFDDESLGAKLRMIEELAKHFFSNIAVSAMSLR